MGLMNKMADRKDGINRALGKFSQNIVVKTLMAGMARVMPVTLVGSFALLIANFPFDPWVSFITDIGLYKYLTLTATLTIDMISLYLIAALSYEMANHYKKSVINAIILSFLCFFIVTPLSDVVIEESSSVVYMLSYFGSKGMFVAIIGTLIATRLYVFFIDKGPKIKMHPSVPRYVTSSFESLIPIAGTAFIFVIVSVIFSNTSYGDVHNLITGTLQKPLEGLGESLSSLLILWFIGEICWWFGINSSVTSPFLYAIFFPLSVANMSAYAAGEPLPYILTLSFAYAFKGPRHFVLSSMLAFMSKSKQLKAVGKVSVIPGLFGISEPMKFGIPMVFNPITFIPMALTPLVSTSIAYFATYIGFMPRQGVEVLWTIPPILQGLIATGWQGAVVQAIQIIACFIIYLPFFRILDNQKLKEEELKEMEEQKNEGVGAAVNG